MPTNNFILLTIVCCGLVTWLSRTLPFVLLKKFSLPQVVADFLSFVPVTILAAMWVQNLFTANLGKLPTINYLNLFASIPTLIAALISKNLSVVVIVGVISAAIFNLLL
ncbi:AzlD domain-containing protein [Lactobacillus sp. ESL0684]|uniref:AzlD domain-containing protein n=1 Tax=Lactobacillus sp. ESL0684 TaxID=2983213 RepID=UPI0023F993E1|nr:AzlD domain-containing protein [Lactobacillus sp. ESL0684]WEV44414.1 AzlD domain-containing protein [Lactobacillus sp. ESL0684]